jgi:hypothetical protein
VDGSTIRLTTECFDAMELIDLLSKLKHLDYTQKKYHVDRHGEYVQLVFSSKHLPAWMESIASILGAPVKMADQPVNKDVIALTEDHGNVLALEQPRVDYIKNHDSKRGHRVGPRILYMRGLFFWMTR